MGPGLPCGEDDGVEGLRDGFPDLDVGRDTRVRLTDGCTFIFAPKVSPTEWRYTFVQGKPDAAADVGGSCGGGGASLGDGEEEEADDDDDDDGEARDAGFEPAG